MGIAARGLSRFVGRDDEAALVLGLVHRLATEVRPRGRVVTVSGEAGIGKSRLVREVQERLPPGVVWLEARSSSPARDSPWHLVIDLLRRTFDLGEDHAHDDVVRAIENRAATWSEAGRAAVGHLRWLLGVPAAESIDVDPRELRAGAIEAVVTVLREMASARPTVVALEDLHWADEASEEAIGALASAVVEMPALLVVTFRPDRIPELGDHSWCTRLVLDGLEPDVTSELAAGTIGAELSAPARQLIVERTSGNPLFVEELAASLLESGAFAIRDGRLALTPGAEATRIPESLHDVVQTRIDRLDEDARHALQLASVIGREFTRRILDRISQLPGELDEHLAELESLELIRQRSWYPELSYLFKHAVVHDVTYSTLLDERRRSLHRLVAEAIEELYAHDLADHCEAIARHWLAADEQQRALPHLIQSAQRALASFALPRAIDAFGQAADIATRLGDLSSALELRQHRGHALLASNDVAKMIAESEQVIELARRAGDVVAEAWAMGIRGLAEFWAHDFEAALEDSRAGFDLAADAARTGDPDAQTAGAALECAAVEAATFAVLGRLEHTDAAFARSDAYVDAATPAARATWLQLVGLRRNWRGEWDAEVDALDVVDDAFLADRILILWTAGLHDAGRGRYRKALDRLHRGLTICERTGELFGRVRILNTIGWIHGELGDDATAVAYNGRSLAEAQTIDVPDREVEANARLNLAENALLHGRLDESAEHLGELERTVRDPEPAEVWMLWRYGQRWRCASGELGLARGGDPADALVLADECREIANRTDSHKYMVRSMRLRGRALAAAQRRSDAVGPLDAAVRSARDLGNPPQLWRSLLARAALDGDAGDFTEARAVIDDVAAGLRDHPLAAALQRSPERATTDKRRQR